MKLYTVDEIAEKLKLSKYTIYQRIKDGDLTAIRLGRCYRISEDDLQKYLDSCKIDII